MKRGSYHLLTEATSSIFPFAEDIIFESQYKRERTIEHPIGMPIHCMSLDQNQSKKIALSLDANTTTDNTSSHVATTQPPSTSTPQPDTQSSSAQCQSTCSKDAIVNHSPEVAEVPEILIPENVDLVESSTAGASKTTNEFEKIDNSSPQRNQSSAIEYVASMNTTTDASTTTKSLKASAIDGERPIEIKDSSTSIITDSQPTIASAAGTVSIASLLLHPYPLASNSNSVYHMTKDSSPTSNEEFKLQKVDPTIVLTPVDSTAALTAAASNAINGVYDKKIEPPLFESLPYDLNKNESAEVAPMLTAPAAVSAETDCFSIRLTAHADSFNTTLGSDDICPHADGDDHSFNITYNIPVSQYMKENRFDLTFV